MEDLMNFIADKLDGSAEHEKEISAYIAALAEDKRKEFTVLIEKLRHQERIQEHNAINDAIEGI